jgi:hypothetical protein
LAEKGKARLRKVLATTVSKDRRPLFAGIHHETGGGDPRAGNFRGNAEIPDGSMPDDRKDPHSYLRIKQIENGSVLNFEPMIFILKRNL